MFAVRRLLICVVVLGIFFAPIRIFAVSTPSAIDVYASQGEAQSVEVPVWNDSSDSATFSFSLVHVAFDTAGEPVLGASAQDVSWLTVSQTQGFFDAGVSRSVTVTAAPTADVSSGSYAFALLATESRGDAFVLTHGTATLIFVTVGAVQAQASCTAFVRQDDGTFSLTLENSSQGILYDEGEIVLRGPLDIALGSAPSNPALHRIFAGQSRTWSTGALTIPWWAFGPVEYSLESDFLSSPCPRISAGFGWLPLGGIVAGIVGVFVIRRRK